MGAGTPPVRRFTPHIRFPPYMDSHIVTCRTGSLGQLIIDRPQALNALSLDMVRALYRTLATWRTDPAIRAVAIRSGTPPAFCAGGDLRFFHEACRDGLHGGQQALEDFFTEEYRLDHLIHHYPKPWLVLMDGIVMGGGMGMAQGGASCVRVVTERARMAMPEVNIGLFPDVGGGRFLSRLPDHVGLYLALSGEAVNPADAVRIGLADFLLPSARMPALLEALQEVGDDNYRACIAEAADAGQLDVEEGLSPHRAAIAQHFSQDSVAAIADSLRHDDSPFARRTLAAMMQRSPLMLCVTFRQLKMARNLALADCLRMERSMIRHCFAHGEVLEGIRAAIIDKDRQPRWQPANLEAVTEAMVDRFFQPAWPADAHPLRDLA